MTRRKPVTTKDKMQNSSPLGVTEVQTVTPEYGIGRYLLLQRWRTGVFAGRGDSCNQFQMGGYS